MKTNYIYQGDALEVLKTFPDESINCCMSSPPYWALRDYGTANWVGGDENCNHQEAKEKSKYDYALNTTKIQDATRKGTDAPRWKDKCPQCGATKQDLQLGLEPTFDEFINNLCNIYDEVKRVLRKDGTCWVNLGDTYNNSSSRNKRFDDKDYSLIQQNVKRKVGRGGQKGYQDKCLCMIPQRFAIEMINRGWILRNVIVWHKPNCMPSSVKDRFTVDFEYIFFFVKSKKYWFDLPREPHLRPEKEPRYASPKVKQYMEMGLMSKREEIKNHPQGRAKRTVWKIPPKPFSEAHFAVYPEELCEIPLKSGCPKGGIVLDMFMGAGTTGVVALKQNKKFIGIELNPDYIKIANSRLLPYLEQMKLVEFKEKQK